MQKMTFKEFCAEAWTLSDVEYSSCTGFNGEQVSSGYIYFANADESETALEEENIMRVSFPWHARKDNAGNVIAEADLFETMFTCDNFYFDRTSNPTNEQLLSHFDSLDWKSKVTALL